MSRLRSWRCWPGDPSALAPAPPALHPWQALDQLLEHSYGDAFARLDVALLLDQPARLRQLLAPFTAVAR